MFTASQEYRADGGSGSLPALASAPAQPVFHLAHYDEYTDEALMEAYVAGDEPAYRVLFDRLAPVLQRIVRRRLSSDDEARDVVQQTFLNMHRFRADFRTGARLRPWLTTIAMNLTREHHRRVGRLRERPLEDTESSRPVVMEVPSPADSVQHTDEVRKAMAGLLDSQRQVIELRWFHDKSYDEISEIVGASVAAVRVRAHRGYERMRGVLNVEACQ